LAKDTFAGAIALANNSPDSFATLREKVTSKGGTTAAALATFDEHGVGKGLQSGALAATRRAEELAIELAK
jgi:pyrroline-5-carboxylate reductase